MDLNSITENLRSRIAKLNLDQVGVGLGSMPRTRGGIVHSRSEEERPPAHVPPPNSRPSSNPFLPQSRPSRAETNPFRASQTPPIDNPQALSPRPRPVSTPAPSAAAVASITTPSTASSCIMCRDFSFVDVHAASFPRHNVYSIPTLAANLTAPFPTRTEKARAIFTWLHHNIAYNTAAYFGGNVRHQTPEETLRSGLAVCQGYAELFAELGRHSGLECKVISGHGKGYGYREPIAGQRTPPPFESNHAWNAVRLDGGEWHLLDACWGAGYVDGVTFYRKFKPEFFTSSAEQFRERHFPKDAADQHCHPSLTWNEYIFMSALAPVLYDDFRGFGFSDRDIRPAGKTVQAGFPVIFELTTKCEHYIIPPHKQRVLVLYVDGVEIGLFEVDPAGKKWTCRAGGDILRRPGAEVQVHYVDTIDGAPAVGLGWAEYARRKGRSGRTFRGLCMWKVA